VVETENGCFDVNALDHDGTLSRFRLSFGHGTTRASLGDAAFAPSSARMVSLFLPLVKQQRQTRLAQVGEGVVAGHGDAPSWLSGNIPKIRS
jgi:hypothetical protein